MTDHVCPDASVLAAFAEGVLPPEQRAEIERHVANCPECPAIVGGVTRFLAEGAEEELAPATPIHRWWYIAAVIAAICIPAVVWRTMSARDPLTAVRQLAASSPERTFEGRLHAVPHVPFQSPRGNERNVVPLPLQRAAQRLEQRDQDADVLHARGVIALLSGDPQKAARLLTDATDSAPNDAAIWNDLSVAELARASRGVPAALPSALEAASRATNLASSSPDAHYNRALALERLGDAGAAADAYRQALRHETSPQWRTEIREHLQRIENAR